MAHFFVAAPVLDDVLSSVRLTPFLATPRTALKHARPQRFQYRAFRIKYQVLVFDENPRGGVLLGRYTVMFREINLFGGLES